MIALLCTVLYGFVGCERGEGIEGCGSAQAGWRGRCPGGRQARQGHPRKGHQGVCCWVLLGVVGSCPVRAGIVAVAA